MPDWTGGPQVAPLAQARNDCFTPKDAFRWIWVLVGLAIVWRIVRYALGFPVWGNESRLMLNLVQRHSYRELLLPLDHLQVAPLGFLAAQFAVIRHFGTSEWALRLFPFATSLVAVGLFARLAWLAVRPIAAMAAVGLLAATHYVTRYSLDIKPYGTDLMVAALLLLLAVMWMRQPDRLRYLVGLVVAIPLAVFFSYPAVFVGGAVSVGLLPTLWRSPLPPGRRKAAWALFIAYNAAMLAAFVLMLHVAGRGQYEATRAGMLYCWGEGMPPANPLRLLLWLIDIHTSELMAYPTGGKCGGSTLTFLLCLGGAVLLWKRAPRQLLLMFGAAFALTFAAAVLRRYPYGSSARVAQHLAPMICLLAGVALEGLILRCRAVRRAADLTAGVLMMVAIGFLVRDIVHPYQSIEDRLVQRFFQQWKGRCTSEQGVWFAADMSNARTPALWHLYRALNWDVNRAVTGTCDGDVLAGHEEWWVVKTDPDVATQSAIDTTFAAAGGTFTRVETITQNLRKQDYLVELQRWRRTGASQAQH